MSKAIWILGGAAVLFGISKLATARTAVATANAPINSAAGIGTIISTGSKILPGVISAAGGVVSAVQGIVGSGSKSSSGGSGGGYTITAGGSDQSDLEAAQALESSDDALSGYGRRRLSGARMLRPGQRVQTPISDRPLMRFRPRARF